MCKKIQKEGGDDITVTYDYNAIGDLLTVTHPDDTQTKYTYDNLGRKLSINLSIMIFILVVVLSLFGYSPNFTEDVVSACVL